MTHGFQQQGAAVGFSIPKSAPTPQHGQKPIAKVLEAKEPRSFKPPIAR